MYSKISRFKFLVKLTSSLATISMTISTVCPMRTDRIGDHFNFWPTMMLQNFRDFDTIMLNKPGNYTLVGNGSFDDKDDEIDDQIIIPIKGYNRIFIKGGGVYNIIMKNVNIKPKCYNDEDMQPPFSNDINAEINLTLIGDNRICGSCGGEIGLSINGSLTITDESTGCLDVVSDGDCAIYANNITIKNGRVKAISELVGIYGLSVSIEGGNVVATSSTTGIYGVNKLKLVHCNIKTSNLDALYPEILPGLLSDANVEIVDGIVNGVRY